jgi:UDP-N-acetylmuramoyl-L-alanyl-D-glutamate--2,6-diaminopimelate ligase
MAADDLAALDGALVVAEDPRRRSPMRGLGSARSPKPMVAVTGTNGKTSVASFTRQIWLALGLRGHQPRHHRGRGRLSPRR